MATKFIVLFLFPVSCLAQAPSAEKKGSHKHEYNLYQEAGVTVKENSYGVHYNWQTQLSKTIYLGAGIEAIRSKTDYKETVTEYLVLPATFRLSYSSSLKGVRVVPFLGTGLVLSQPTGTVVEAGVGAVIGKWQLGTSYRNYNTGGKLPPPVNGLYLRLTRLFIKIATKPRFK